MKSTIIIESTEQPKAAFTRDAFTWQAYVLLAFYSFFIDILGPITPFLKAKLNISYTLASFHFSAFAVGMILAGLSGDRVVGRLGRQRALWYGVTGMAFAALAVALGEHPAVTIAGAFLMGILGSLTLVTTPSMLSDHHYPRQAVAMSEANSLASFASASAPMLVGLMAGFFGDWRIALYFPVLALIILRLVFRTVSDPHDTRAAKAAAPKGSLPLAFWMYWVLLVLVVSIEFCMIYWGSDYLENVIGLTRPNAALLLSLFLWAMMISRLLGSVLVRRISSTRLIYGALFVCLVGFLLFWTWALPVPAIAGLFITGLGVANLYPLSLSCAIGVAAEHSNLASARSTLASGTAILCLPLLLGSVADRVGIGRAYGIIIVLILLAAGVLWLSGRLESQNSK